MVTMSTNTATATTPPITAAFTVGGAVVLGAAENCQVLRSVPAVHGKSHRHTKHATEQQAQRIKLV